MYGIKRNVKKIKIKKRLSKLLNFKDTTSTFFVVVKKRKTKNKQKHKQGRKDGAAATCGHPGGAIVHVQ